MENKKWRNIYIYILISLIALTVIIIFGELIILDNYKKNDISYINIFISAISVIATTVLSVLLYLTNLRSNKINENVVIMTQQQNYTQNYLMLMEKKKSISIYYEY